MAYINAEQVKEIRNKIKAKYPAKNGWKFSIKNNNHSSVDAVIIEAPFNLLSEDKNNRGYYRVEEYYLNDYKDEYSEIFKDIISMLKTEDYFDDSDTMTDYFHVSHYYSLYVGNWDKQFKVSNKGKK